LQGLMGSADLVSAVFVSVVKGMPSMKDMVGSRDGIVATVFGA